MSGEQVKYDPNDDPNRKTVALTPMQIAALEAEKKSLLERIDLPTPAALAAVPRARRSGAGSDDYPDQRATHEPAPPTREELDDIFREGQEVRSKKADRPTFVPGEPYSIESLAAEVNDAEQRWKDAKARLKKALKRLGVK